MSKKSQGQHRARYTLEFKLEAVRLVKAGQEASVTAHRLLASGRPASTPVVVVENCSRADQRILRLTLATLAHGLGAKHGPVLVMLGDAMTAHALTNFLLGIWVVWKGAWSFW